MDLQQVKEDKIKRGLLSTRNVFKRFKPQLLNENLCRRGLFDLAHNFNPACFFCGHLISEKFYIRFYADKSIRCVNCCRRFKATTGTPLARVRTDYRQLVFLCVLREIGFDLKDIGNILEKPTSWVRKWADKIDPQKNNDGPKIVCKNSESLVSEFVETCIFEDPQAEISAAELYKCFQKWWKINVSWPVLSQKKFGGIMAKRFKRMKTGTYKYLEIGLIYDFT